MGNNGIYIIVSVVFIFLIMMVLVSMFQRSIDIFNYIGKQQCKASNADHDKGNDVSDKSKNASVNTNLVNESSEVCVDVSLQDVQSKYGKA